MPMGSRPLDQSQSIAWLVTRTQPCEAGNGGTSGNPCTATPPVKYFGRYSTPSGPGSYPSTCRNTVYRPVGVVPATRPVLASSTHSVRPSRTRNTTCRARLTSISVPPVLRGFGRCAPASTRLVSGPSTPSRSSPASFWNAVSACTVADPYRPSGVPSQYPRPASRCCTARTSGPLAPGRSRSGRGDADGLGTGGLDPDGEAGRLDPDGEAGRLDPDGEAGRLDPDGEAGRLDPDGEAGRLDPD